MTFNGSIFGHIYICHTKSVGMVECCGGLGGILGGGHFVFNNHIQKKSRKWIKNVKKKKKIK